MISSEALFAVFLTSLLGSGHCVAMCGGFVALYSMGCDKGGQGKVGAGEGWLRHFFYNSGRLLSYLLLGGLAGAFGATLDKSVLEHFHLSSAVIAGVVIIAWGLSMIAVTLGWQIKAGGFSALFSPITKRISKLYHTFLSKPGKRSALILGLCSGLLPCGWLYLYVTAAAGAGSFFRGMLVMLAFWSGTVPVMLAFGGLAYKLTSKLRSKLPIISGVLMIILGLLTVSGRLMPHDHGDHGAHHAPAISSDSQQLVPHGQHAESHEHHNHH